MNHQNLSWKVLETALSHLKNDFKLTLSASEVRQRLSVNRNRSTTRQVHSRDLISIFLNSSSRSTL